MATRMYDKTDTWDGMDDNGGNRSRDDEVPTSPGACLPAQEDRRKRQHGTDTCRAVTETDV